MAFQFLMKYSNVILRLNRLTGMRFIGTSSKSGKPIEQFVKRTLDFHNKRRYDLRDFEFLKLGLLVNNLEEIEKQDNKLFAKMKKQLLKSLEENEYYGARFEISIAASLIRKGVDFIKRESPDFSINHKKRLFIECTSCHLTEPKTGDINYKIMTTIETKSYKNYCNPKTALFVDVTNLYYASLQKGVDLEKKAIYEYGKEVLHGTKFGGLIFFVYLYDIKLKQYKQIHVRIDNQCINETLRDFLDTWYPYGNLQVGTHRIPPVG